jgi:hypothetical protein
MLLRPPASLEHGTLPNLRRAFLSAETQEIAVADRANEDEVSGPEKDLKAQNPGQTIVGEQRADDVEADDPHKAEKLAKAGRDDDPQAGEE